MATSPDKAPQDKKKPQAPAPTDLAGAHVLRLLGRPADLSAVQARHLWGNNFRVNIFVGDTASRKIAHSYFLVLDGEGKLLWTEPKIAHTYESSTTDSLQRMKNAVAGGPVRAHDEGSTPPG
jgi:hypothetical protein